MALSLKNAELLISTVLVLITYFMSVSIVGYIRAVVANNNGDDTPEKLGFLTLNPLVHASKLWVVLIIIFQLMYKFMPFGLGRYIPLNHANIRGAHTGLRVLLVYLSDSIASIVLSISAFFALVLMYGVNATQLIVSVVSLKHLASVGSGLTSFHLVFSWFLIALFFLNSLMAAFSIIINLFHYVALYYYGDMLQENEYADLIIMFGPLIFLYLTVFFVSDYIRLFVVTIAYLLGHLVGAV